LPVTNAMSEKLRLQEPIRSPLETPRLITPLPYRSGTSFLAWAIVNNNQPVPDVFSKMTKIAASGRLGHPEGSVAKIVKLEHAWRRLDGRNDDGFQVAPFPG
ncbi:hypothetical protein OSJ57_26880, partial [Sphingomonas sp. HH69]